MDCKIRKTISLLCVVGWMAVIFFFSAQPADKSSHMSLSVGRVIGNFVVSDYKQLPGEKQDNFAKNIEYGVRKIAHLSEYAVLGVLLFWTVTTWMDNKKEHIFFSAALGGVYAATDEFHQLFVHGRSGSIADVMIDTVGVIIGVLCISLFWRRMRRRKNSMQDSR